MQGINLKHVGYLKYTNTENIDYLKNYFVQVGRQIHACIHIYSQKELDYYVKPQTIPKW